MTGKRTPRAPDDLQTIPGVGPSLAQDLRERGISQVADLCGQDPEQLYARLIAQRGVHQDRCVLYVFRCAVYFAETPRPEPERLKWWHWKDPRPAAPARRSRSAPSGVCAR
jgi:hypothetical protein